MSPAGLLEGGSFSQHERPDTHYLECVLNCLCCISCAQWLLCLDLIAACSSARLRHVDATVVAQRVLDCLQQQDAWLGNVAEATCPTISIVWFNLVLFIDVGMQSHDCLLALAGHPAVQQFSCSRSGPTGGALAAANHGRPTTVAGFQESLPTSGRG